MPLVIEKESTEAMENTERVPHVLFVPFPAQGHMNPSLQFAKRLASQGLKLTVATTIAVEKSKHAEIGQLRVEHICNIREHMDGADTTRAYMTRLETVITKALEELVEKHQDSGDPYCCIVYDSILPWVLKVARRFGLYGGPFFTQPCGVDAIFYHVYHRQLTVPLQDSTVSLPRLPEFEISELPSFVSIPHVYEGACELLADQFCNLEDADWGFINTFDKLEPELISWMKELWPVKAIGPSVPSMFVDMLIDGDYSYGLDLFTPKGDVCTKWLDSKPTGSVVYVSLGSISSLGPEGMEEMAWALRGIEQYFFWVVRATEVEKLPRNFAEETTGKGLIVSWCSQLEVLAHQAIGCFVTHCGWNSTIEALSLGVPLVAMPQWADQPTNAKYVEDVWRAGVRVKSDSTGIVRREEIESCVREVMEGERGKEVRKNATEWSKFAKEALEEGGTSSRNIKEFVSVLKSKTEI